jgi:hypothetical protein
MKLEMTRKKHTKKKTLQRNQKTEQFWQELRPAIEGIDYGEFRHILVQANHRVVLARHCRSSFVG